MDITVTHLQGRTLLGYLGAGIRMPEKLGTDKDAESYDDIERVFCDEQLTKMRKLLMSYCTKKPEHKAHLFGIAENYKLVTPPRSADPRDPQKAYWDCIDDDAPFKIRLDDDEREGLYWALLLMSHPASPGPVAIDQLDKVVWPVARELGCDKQLRKALKLDQRKGKRILWDDDKVWDNKESKKPRLLEDEPIKEAAKS